MNTLSKIIAAGAIAGAIVAGIVYASPIRQFVFENKVNNLPNYPIYGAEAILTHSGNLADTVRHRYTDFSSRWFADTRDFNPDLHVGEILYIAVESLPFRLRQSFIIQSIDHVNYLAGGVFANDTSKAFSLTIANIDNQLEIPDSLIKAKLWADKEPSAMESTYVDRYADGSKPPGYHKLVLGVEGDSTITTGDWMKWILQFSRNDTTFRTQDSFQVDKPFDGNARLIDTVIFPKDTIPPVGVEQPGLLLEIKQNSVLPTIVKAPCFRPELAGQNIYSANGRKVNKQTLTRSLSPGIYYVIKKDATSPKKLIVVR